MNSNDTIVKKDSLILLVPAEILQKKIMETVKTMTDAKLKCIYVSLNRPAENVVEGLKKLKISTDDVRLIDGISVSVGYKPVTSKNIIFMSDPSDLTGLSIAIGQFMESLKGEKFIISDVIKTMLLYNDMSTVVSFVNTLVSKAKEYNVKIRVILMEKEDKMLYSKIKNLFDETVELND